MTLAKSRKVPGTNIAVTPDNVVVIVRSTPNGSRFFYATWTGKRITAKTPTGLTEAELLACDRVIKGR